MPTLLTMFLRYFTTGPHLRRALALWAVLAVAVCVKIVGLGGDHTVYPVFAAGARHWWADRPLYADYSSEGIDEFRYSPTFAVAFTPLAYLPDRLGSILWNVGSIALLVWALHVLIRDVLSSPSAKRWSPWQERVFLTLTLAGSAVGIWSGQSNALVTALIALALAAIVRGRWWTASLLLAVPVFIKLWPLAIALLLIACWPRSLAWRFAVMCLVLALAPLLTRPPDVVASQYSGWYARLTDPNQTRHAGYRDAWTFWEQAAPLVHSRANWQSGLDGRLYSALQLTSALAVLGWCLWQRRRILAGVPLLGTSSGIQPTDTPHCLCQAVAHQSSYVSCDEKRLLTLVFSMWAVWQLLFGPATEQLTYGIVAPAAAWAVLTSFAEKRGRWLTVTAWVLLSIAPAGDVEASLVRISPTARMLPPLGAVLLAAWLLWHERGVVVPSPAGRGPG